MSQQEHNRIEFLDGLRGVAIILVVIFHAYARWPNLYPFGSQFSEIKFFAYGWLGVHLFFLISGFVIFLTLDRCENIFEFLVRRWLRLFPAMLICSLLIWYTAPYFPERPAGAVTAEQLIPGLTFISPAWFSRLGLNVNSIEGAFWSLFVEVRFYFVAGISYFFLGSRRGALAIILTLYATSIVGTLIQGPMLSLDNISIFKYIFLFLQAFSVSYYGWFGAGALFYVYYSTKSLKVFVFGVIVIVCAAISEHGITNLDVKFPALLIAILFMMSIAITKLQRILSNRLLLFFGYISYPLYLLHENMMVALIIRVGKWTPALPSILMPLAPIGFVLFLAWLIAGYLEPPVKVVLRAGYQLARQALLQTRCAPSVSDHIPSDRL